MGSGCCKLLSKINLKDILLIGQFYPTFFNHGFLTCLKIFEMMENTDSISLNEASIVILQSKLHWMKEKSYQNYWTILAIDFIFRENGC